MYWIYLAIFVLIVLTPKIIQEGVLFFREEDVESLIIFCFGLLAFTLYLIKEKALLRVFREKLNLQKKTNIITKDLSDSYSYIGEMNRRFDIVKELMFRLPKDTAEGLAKKESEIFRPILEAVKLLAKTDIVSLRFVNVKTKELEKIFEGGHSKTFASFDAKRLLASKKTFWEEKTCAIVRSPLQAKGLIAYIVFFKTSNHIEDADIFKILASQALLLCCIDRYGIAKEKENFVPEKK